MLNEVNGEEQAYHELSCFNGLNGFVAEERTPKTTRQALVVLSRIKTNGNL